MKKFHKVVLEKNEFQENKYGLLFWSSNNVVSKKNEMFLETLLEIKLCFFVPEAPR